MIQVGESVTGHDPNTGRGSQLHAGLDDGGPSSVNSPTVGVGLVAPAPAESRALALQVPPAAVVGSDVVSAASDGRMAPLSASIVSVASRVLKRTTDIAVGILGLAITLAVFPLALLLVCLDSPGPVIYGQRRVGRDRRRAAGRIAGRRNLDYGGRPFTVYKLRTMHCDAESHGPRLATEDDPRTTRIGRLMRRYHIDEWPQFLCILSGKMSLVGPRPERPLFAVRYRSEFPPYRCRTAGIRPGLIGLSQILVGYDHSLASVRAKAELDSRYRELVICGGCHWPAIDTRVVLQTVRYMCGRRPDGKVHQIQPPSMAEQYEERAG
jgi:lipopolysaccharide/colanic/teichoic acid biosynthesis glycosyltransferase